MNMPSLSQEQVFLIGMYCFLITAIASVFIFFYHLSDQSVLSGLVSWSMIVFYFVISYFFGYQYRIMKGVGSFGSVVDSKLDKVEVDKILDEIKNNKV
jgi:c-di-AMP phosphodiesterase-like protein